MNDTRHLPGDGLSRTALRSAAQADHVPFTPPHPQPLRTELVGDANLIELAGVRPQLDWVIGILLRVQFSTYRRTGHIISYADEYVWRRIKMFNRYATLPNIHCRCIRCNCRALLLDWYCALDWQHPELIAKIKARQSLSDPVSDAYRSECQGEALLARLLWP